VSDTLAIFIGYVVGSIATWYLTYKYAYERGAGIMFEFLLDHNFVRYKIINGERAIVRLDHKDDEDGKADC